MALLVQVTYRWQEACQCEKVMVIKAVCSDCDFQCYELGQQVVAGGVLMEAGGEIDGHGL